MLELKCQRPSIIIIFRIVIGCLLFVIATLVTVSSSGSNNSSSALPPNAGVQPNVAKPVPSSIANNATIISNPKCPHIQTTVDLQVDKMSGVWFKTGSYPFFFNKNVMCEYMVIEEVNSNEWNYLVHQYNTSLLCVFTTTLLVTVSASSSGSSSSNTLHDLTAEPSDAFTSQPLSSLPSADDSGSDNDSGSETEPSTEPTEQSPSVPERNVPEPKAPAPSVPMSVGVPPNAASPVPNSIANNAASNLKCPLVRTTVDLKVHEMGGVWYKTGSYPYFFNNGMKCAYMVIDEVNSNEWNYRVHQYNTSSGQSVDESGSCTINRNSNPQSITATFSTPGVYLVNYRILKLKYAQLAVLNACMYRGHEFLGHLVWALTRTQYPTDAQWTTILAYAKEFGLNPDKITKINQATCTEPAPNIPIPMAFHRKLSKNSR